MSKIVNWYTGTSIASLCEFPWRFDALFYFSHFLFAFARSHRNAPRNKYANSQMCLFHRRRRMIYVFIFGVFFFGFYFVHLLRIFLLAVSLFAELVTSTGAQVGSTKNHQLDYEQFMTDL